MKIAVLGNSHIAAIKKAWDEISEANTDIRLTFFASRGATLENLRYESGRLCTDNQRVRQNISYTSGGLEEISIAEYDIFLLYGLEFCLCEIPKGVSSAVLRQTCQDEWEFSTASYLLSLIKKSEHEVKVYLTHTPLTCVKASSSFAAGSLIPYATHWDISCEIIRKAGGNPVSQSSATIVADHFTDAKFSRGALRLNLGDLPEGATHGINDVSHMNTEFGRLWITDFLQKIRRD